ncbi:MAG: hypothetical protein RIE77_13275 [Phycisphaerales bacterium]|jgi:hypothetical protein
MHVRTLAAALIAATTMSVASPQAFGQSGGRAGVSGSVSDDRRFITLEFTGGSLDAFIRQIRKSAGESPVNILYPQEFAELQLPAMQFEQVDVATALRVAAGLSESRPMLMPDGREAMWEVAGVGGGGGAPVFLISVYAEELDEEHGESEPEHEEYFERFTMVQSLAGLIAGEHALGADAVLSSIEIALDMVEQGDADLRFHEDTGLLFARVTMDQQHAIEETVGRLTESASFMRRAQSQSQFSEFLDALQVDSQKEAIQIVREARQTAEQIGVQQAQMEDMRRAIESEHLTRERQAQRLEQEIAALQLELRQVRTVAEDLERQNQRLKDERETLRSELEAMRAERRPRQ